MFKDLHFYASPNDIPGFFDTFFGGMFVVPGLPLVLLEVWVVFVMLSMGCIFMEQRQKNFPAFISQFLSYTAFILAVPLMNQPWDEVFINLRHSLHFAEYNTFSFNAHERIEGTVDFLPYFLIGCLGKLGLSIPEMGWWQCLIGGLLCVSGGVKILTTLNKSASYRSLVTLLLCCFPPLLLNAATGFATTLFAGVIIWAVYFLFFSSHTLFGVFCLALVPLVRTEGLLLFVLLGAAVVKATPKKIPMVFLGIVPFILLTLWRFNYYGHLIPIPIVYKATLGDSFYAILGLRGFFADIIAGGAAGSILVLALAMVILPRSIRLLPLGLIFAFSLPYYLGGGDWFPSCWARYLFPFCLLSFVYAIASCTLLTQKKKWTPALLVAVIAITIVTGFPRFHAFYRAFDLLVFPRPTLAMLSLRFDNRAHYRVHHLSRVGNHLGASMLSNEVIASSEVATIQYFAKREAIDFLGVANMEVATAPIRPTPPILRKREKEAHLPYTIFRKLNPSILESRRPEVLYTFDFIPGILVKEIPEREWGDKEVKLAFSRWLERYRILVDSLYGGYAELARLGYSPIVVKYGDDFMTCYFVLAPAKAGHLARLEALGLSGKNLNN